MKYDCGELDCIIGPPVVGGWGPGRTGRPRFDEELGACEEGAY